MYDLAEDGGAWMGREGERSGLLWGDAVLYRQVVLTLCSRVLPTATR